ncbi:SET and MYND domain-containing protein DDB_G0273589-like [Lepeophtheirus salmonis]|uniref:SET and MYND domain-containing protein DDB_G0273589-like n=1 Tax=Lepeophtheirus salmonis TaxID=72036 RepID=UPI001AE35788|nr:SET and MYND domain-containing protein DDB_G0273589-like [Lepeophtheirus salmonis]
MTQSPQFRNLNQMCFEEFLLKCHQDVINSRLKLSAMPLELGTPSLGSLTEILPYLNLNVDQGLPDENLAKFLLLRCEALNESKYNGLQISLDIVRDVRMALGSGYLGAAERWRALVLLVKYISFHYHSIGAPSISSDLDFNNKLEIRYTPDKGRSIFAKRDLGIGTIVSSERPLVAFIHSKHSAYSHCVHCFRTTFNPLPCPSCNHSVFCSLECLRKKKSHHYYECQMGLDGIIAKLCPKTSMPLGKILILRLITQKKYRFFRSKYSNDKIDYTYFRPEPELMDESYDRLWHKIRIFTNDSGTKKLSFMDGFFYLLKKATNYFEDALPSDFENVYRTMQHYEAILDGNSFTLEEFYDRKRILGSALYDYSSFYNHSCDPNACFIFDSAKRIRVIVTSPVLEGEEITISYGPLVWNQRYEERLNKLKNYNFICRCIACKNKISPGEENDPHFKINELQDQPEVVLEKIAKGEYGDVCSKSKLKNIIHLCSWFLYGQ